MCELNLKSKITAEQEEVIKCVLGLAHSIRKSVMLKGRGVKITEEDYDRSLRV